MFPGIDPKKMQAVMRQMGIKQEEIDAIRVIIETSDKNIIINNPSVVRVNMQGQDSFQISGDIAEEEKTEDTTDQDVQTIIEKTGCSEKQARDALEEANGDLAEAILSLS
jgi:nascent polypeptide-associated complex subunit alpha